MTIKGNYTKPAETTLEEADRVLDVLSGVASDLDVSAEQLAALRSARDELAKLLQEKALPGHYAVPLQRKRKAAQVRADNAALTLAEQVKSHRNMCPVLKADIGFRAALPRESCPATITESPDLALEKLGASKVALHFGRMPWNSKYRSMPDWAGGCYIYRKRAGEDQFEFVTAVKKSPFVDEVEGSAEDYVYAAKYYRSTWPRSVGPMSEPASSKSKPGKVA